MSDHDVPTTAGSGGSKLPLLLGGLILLVALAVGAWVAMNPDALFGTPVKKVGSIDRDAIFTLQAFKDAEKQLVEMREKKQKEFQGLVDSKKLSNEELQMRYQKMQMELQQETNKIINPLQTKAEAAVAIVARNKGLTVVLDKKIVVYGVPDITEDVKKTFETAGELTLPAAEDTSKAPIAYFDQDVVRSLKVFQEADLRVFQKRNELMKEFEKRVASVGSPSEKEALGREFMARLEAYREQIMAPLYQKVTASVNEVAEAQGISLVLDKQNVMYGGRNITEAVVDTFLQKTGQPEGAAPASGNPATGASPAAAQSPAAGSK